MEQGGYTRKDLERLLGSRARVAEVPKGNRGLSVEMVRALLIKGMRSTTRYRGKGKAVPRSKPKTAAKTSIKTKLAPKARPKKRERVSHA